jgi:hypothetical protein
MISGKLHAKFTFTWWFSTLTPKTALMKWKSNTLVNTAIIASRTRTKQSDTKILYISVATPGPVPPS